MISLLLLQKILSLFLILFTGVLLVKSKLLSASDSRVLSVLSIYLIMPCVIISAFQVDLTDVVKRGLMLSFGAAIAIHGILIFLSEVWKRMFHLDAVELTSIVYSNAGNLIIPLVVSVLGPEWVIYSSAYVSVQMVFLWTHGKAALCGEHTIDLKRILGNINMIAIVLGLVLLLTGLRFPSPVQDAMDSVGAMLGPSAMLVTGMLLGNMRFSKIISYRRLWLIAALRLLICPVIILFALKVMKAESFVPHGDKIVMITLLATMTPSASSITQMAQVYGKDADYAGVINLISTILCIITMPCMVALYQMF